MKQKKKFITFSDNFGSMYNYHVFGVKSEQNIFAFLSDLSNAIAVKPFFLCQIAGKTKNWEAQFDAYHFLIPNQKRIRCYVIDNRKVISDAQQLFPLERFLFGSAGDVAYKTISPTYDFLVFCVTAIHETQNSLLHAVQEECKAGENMYKEFEDICALQKTQQENFLNKLFVELEVSQSQFNKNLVNHLTYEYLDREEADAHISDNFLIQQSDYEDQMMNTYKILFDE